MPRLGSVAKLLVLGRWFGAIWMTEGGRNPVPKLARSARSSMGAYRRPTV